MTVGVFVNHGTCIEAFTDGGAFDDYGRMGQYSNKLRHIPHLSAFVFASGEGHATRIAKDNLSHCSQSFDGMVDRCEAMVKLASVDAHLIYGDIPNVRVVIGGYSERDQEWQIWTYGLGLDDDGEVRTLGPDKSTNFLSNVFPSDEKLTEYGFGTFDDFQWNYELSDGIRFMEAIRNTKFQIGPMKDVEGCLCGGFIERHIIQHDKAYSEIVHRWPDKIGELMGINDDVEA